MAKAGSGGNRVSCKECEMFTLCQPLKLGDMDMDLTKHMLKPCEPIERDDTLFRNGSSFSSIYAVCSGSFKLTVPASDDQDRVIDFRFPGELLGMGAIHSGRHCSDAVAMEDCTVCELPFQVLNEFGMQIPMLQARMIELMSQELAQRQRMLVLLMGLKSSDERIAAFLLGVSLRFKAHGRSSHSFKLAMSRTDIASYLGLAKETVSRVLVSFQRDGILQLSGKNIEITDISELATRASAVDCVVNSVSPSCSLEQ